jgi:hypothetical protein
MLSFHNGLLCRWHQFVAIIRADKSAVIKVRAMDKQPFPVPGNARGYLPR